MIPPDLAARLASDVEPAQLEVLYNGNALEQSLVQSTLNSALAQANLGFSEQIQQAAGDGDRHAAERRQPRHASARPKT